MLETGALDAVLGVPAVFKKCCLLQMHPKGERLPGGAMPPPGPALPSARFICPRSAKFWWQLFGVRREQLLWPAPLPSDPPWSPKSPAPRGTRVPIVPKAGPAPGLGLGGLLGWVRLRSRAAGGRGEHFPHGSPAAPLGEFRRVSLPQIILVRRGTLTGGKVPVPIAKVKPNSL